MKNIVLIGVALLVLIYALISFEGRLVGEWQSVSLIITPFLGTLFAIGVGIFVMARRR